MDLSVVETGNGGDLVKGGQDLKVVYGFENMPYLALFGGNVEADTPTERLENEQAFDWWGNSLLFPNEPSLQLNSQTERALRNVPLTSSGRQLIEEAVKADLDFMRPFAEVSVSVTIPAHDRVKIAVTLREPDNLQEKEFIYIWDATEQGLAGSFVPNPVVIEEEYLQSELQAYL